MNNIINEKNGKKFKKKNNRGAGGDKTPPSEKFKLFAEHIEIFKEAFAGYLRQKPCMEQKSAEAETCGEEGAGTLTGAEVKADTENEAGDGFNVMLFEGLLSNYYRTVISALKKLAGYDKKYIPALIETYVELWMSAPRLNDRDYICPYLFDLCKFLYETCEAGALAFFYNLLIYCREIPFLSLNGEQEKKLADDYESGGGGDPFAEFRKERRERIAGSFDESLFNKTYDKFFLILSGWREKIEGYYTKDEICFTNGLFIMDELADFVYCEEKAAGEFSGGETTKACAAKINTKEIFRNADKPDGGGKNIYLYVHGGETKEKISRFYEKALRYFKRAINYNPNNPRYYYEYARCLKNSGKSDEAEIFFKKAFDLNG